MTEGFADAVYEPLQLREIYGRMDRKRYREEAAATRRNPQIHWPENFFGDEMEDLVARAEAQAKRMGKKDLKGAR